jgi:hypothetical protein
MAVTTRPDQRRHPRHRCRRGALGRLPQRGVTELPDARPRLGHQATFGQALRIPTGARPRC